MYVSGASDKNVKRPAESAVTRAICEGLVALTRAPAIGALVAASTTVPLMVPVVAASVLLAEQMSDAQASSVQMARTGIELLNASSANSSNAMN